MNWEHPEEVMRARILGTAVACHTCRHWDIKAAGWCLRRRYIPDNWGAIEPPVCEKWRQPE